MFSVNKFLKINENSRNLYLISDDSKQSFTVSAFKITSTFVSANLIKIRLGSDDVITLQFSTNAEAKQALQKLLTEIDLLRQKVPFIIPRDIKNYFEC